MKSQIIYDGDLVSVELRTCDDWIAVYRDGVRVFQSHSCRLSEGLKALGIEFVENDYDKYLNDYGEPVLPDGSSPFPEHL